MLVFISVTAHKAVEMLGLTTPNCCKSAVYGHNMGGVSLSVPHIHLMVNKLCIFELTTYSPHFTNE